MRGALTCPSPVLLALLDTCASRPQQQPVDSATAVTAVIDASADNDWQTLHANYMACVQRQADSGVSSATQTKDVVASALDTCEGALHTMHDGFHDHLNTSISSSGACEAADRITKGIREEARVYLMGYIGHTRYPAKLH